MAGFNFSEAVGEGLGFSWRNRAQIAPHAFWPLALKISIFVLITLLGLENNALRQGLFMLPSFILEGFLVAYVVRFAMLGEAQPLMLARHSDDTAEIISHKRAVFAAVLAYVLVKIIVSFGAGIILASGNAMTPSAQGASSPPGGLIAAIALAAGMMWGFRLLWIYIPIALDYPPGLFLKRIEGFKISFNMLGLWILCMMPASVIVLLLAQIITGVFPGPAENTLSIPSAVLLAVIQAVVETAVAVAANVSMAFGLREALGGKKKTR